MVASAADTREADVHIVDHYHVHWINDRTVPIVATTTVPGNSCISVRTSRHE